MKPYKVNPPIFTINFIRRILAELGVLLNETHEVNNNFHSCNIRLINNNLTSLGIGSNGKGKSSEYSLASAYAEFMERLQNSLLLKNTHYSYKDFINSLPENNHFRNLLISENLISDFIYDPSEKFFTIDQSLEMNGGFINSLLFSNDIEISRRMIIQDLHYDKLLMVPFLSVFDKKETLLPIELILSCCGSNGMCAGNTPQEAILQGCCEIFERYAGKIIYNKRLSLPSIPIDYFKKSDIYEKIVQIANIYDYQIIIKDCSLGIGLPVIGVLIIDSAKQQYSFNLGSDFNPLVALERCLTEIHQNHNGILWMPFDFDNYNKACSILDENVYDYFNLTKIFTTSSGQWPISIFKEQGDWEFEGFNSQLGISDQTDYEFCKEKIKEIGCDLYIRDNSYLGFPAYYVVIPGMSQYSTKGIDISFVANVLKKLGYLNRFNNLSVDELTELATLLDRYYDTIKYIGIGLTDGFNNLHNEDFSNLDIELFLFMLFYKLRNTTKSLHYLSLFLKGKDRINYIYFYAIYDYLSFKNKGLKDISELMMTIYGSEVAAEILNDLADPDLIFQYLDFPTCFNCEQCKVSTDCHLIDSIRLSNKIKAKQKERMIKQIDLLTNLNEVKLDILSKT